MLIRLIEGLFVFWCTILMLRLFLQHGGMHISHPLANLCASATNFAVRPARKLIPPVKGWDMALVVVAFVCLLLIELGISLYIFFSNNLPFNAISVLFAVGHALLLLSVCAAYALIACLVIQMVLSFSDPYNPLMLTVNRVLYPLTRPFRFLRIGQFDFSGSVVFLALWLWVGAVVPYLRYFLQ
ncbi:MAG: YggT family protein [Neisseriaceae bacterium]|nr:YggT family protein [Neisseriaceae bacterium]